MSFLLLGLLSRLRAGNTTTPAPTTTTSTTQQPSSLATIITNAQAIKAQDLQNRKETAPARTVIFIIVAIIVLIVVIYVLKGVNSMGMKMMDQKGGGGMPFGKTG